MLVLGLGCVHVLDSVSLCVCVRARVREKEYVLPGLSVVCVHAWGGGLTIFVQI